MLLLDWVLAAVLVVTAASSVLPGPRSAGAPADAAPADAALEKTGVNGSSAPAT
jgi:hypothetical protein